MSEAEDTVRKLIEARGAVVALRVERDTILWDQLPSELKQAQKEIEEEYEPKIREWEAEVKKADAEARTKVLQARQTITVDGLSVEYSSGRAGGIDEEALATIAHDLRNCWLVQALVLADQAKFAEALDDFLRQRADAIKAARLPAGKPYVSIKEKKAKEEKE